jgi:hypothetical protein
MPIPSTDPTRFDSLTAFLLAAARSGNTVIRIAHVRGQTILGAAPADNRRARYTFTGPLAAKFVAAACDPESPVVHWAYISEDRRSIVLDIGPNELTLVETWVRSFAQGRRLKRGQALPAVSMNPQYTEIFSFGDWGSESAARQAALVRFEELRVARRESLTYDRWTDQVEPRTKDNLPMAGIKTTASLTLTSGVDGRRSKPHRAAYILTDQAAQILASGGQSFARVGEVRMRPANLL